MNPRKRKLVRDGRMHQMADEQEDKKIVNQSDKSNKGTGKVSEEKEGSLMDPFIAKEKKEIERISSSENKKTTKKKIKLKKKTGGK